MNATLLPAISAAIMRDIDGGVDMSAAPEISSTGSLSSLSRACVISFLSGWRNSRPISALCSSSIQAFTPSGLATRIADDTVAGFGEHRLLIAPDEPTAGRRMQEHDRGALPARVPVPELAARDLRHGLLGGRLRRDRGRAYRAGGGLGLRRVGER